MPFKPYIFAFFIILTTAFCTSPGDNANQDSASQPAPAPTPLKVGAERFEAYIPALKDKRIGLVVNQTSVVGNVHLVDTLLQQGVNIIKIFAPEHGFRGKQDRGVTVEDGKDSKSGLPLVSLYGRNKKPSEEMLSDLDVIIFDIQDVGARFYTYISTMHYVMEAAAEQGKEVVVLDRPNPNGQYVDGPVLDPEKRSFIGMHEIPIVHGCTVGEIAQMINGEGWLANGVKCNLKVITCENYKHEDEYSLPIKPSPNLPNDLSIKLYPSLCLFEGTNVSLGRGTTYPFQVLGYPDSTFGEFTFTPVSLEGFELNPKFKDEQCFGEDFRGKEMPRSFFIDKLLEYYHQHPDQSNFFLKSFDLLAGTPTLREQMEAGWTEEQIRATWKEDLDAYKLMREKYLLYP